MKEQKMSVTEAEVEEAMVAYIGDVLKATGDETTPQLFKDFRIPPKLQALAKEAFDIFATGDLALALNKTKQAKTWLDRDQRKYCSLAVNIDAGVTLEESEKFFDKSINRLPWLDPEHTAELKAHYDEFVAIAKVIRMDDGVTLEDASKSYWKLFNAIAAAPRKQEERNRAQARARDHEDEIRREQEREDRRRQRSLTARSLSEQLSRAYAQMR